MHDVVTSRKISANMQGIMVFVVIEKWRETGK